MLDPEINREAHRLHVPLISKTHRMQVPQPLPVDIFFQSGNAAIVHIDMADNVACGLAAGIKPAVFGEKPYARDAEMMDRITLFRRNLTLQPHEAGTAFQFAACTVDLQIGDDRHQTYDGLIHVEDAARLGVQGVGFQVGRQNQAIAIGHVRPRRRDGILGSPICDARSIRRKPEMHQTPRDQSINAGKQNHRKHQTNLGLLHGGPAKLDPGRARGWRQIPFGRDARR